MTKVSPQVMQNNYMFRARRTSAANSPNATAATIVFNTVDYDYSSAYNSSTGVFTAPVAGVYRFTTSLLLTTTVTRMFIAVAGTRLSDISSAIYGSGGSVEISLAAATTVTCDLWTASVAALDVSGSNCVFTGCLIRAT